APTPLRPPENRRRLPHRASSSNSAGNCFRGLQTARPPRIFQPARNPPRTVPPQTITRDVMQSNDSEWSGEDRPTWVRYQVLASACSLAVITYIHRVGFATAWAEFKTPLNLSDDQLGTVMAAFMIGYGLFEMPWGFLGDRFGVRHAVAAIVLGGSILTALLVLVAYLPPQAIFIVGFLLVIRFLFGAFQAGTFPCISP